MKKVKYATKFWFVVEIEEMEDKWVIKNTISHNDIFKDDSKNWADFNLALLDWVRENIKNWSLIVSAGSI